jgi:hypothetical protein
LQVNGDIIQSGAAAACKQLFNSDERQLSEGETTYLRLLISEFISLGNCAMRNEKVVLFNAMS